MGVRLQSLSNTNMKLSASTLAVLTLSCLPASLATPESLQFEVDFYKAMYREQEDDHLPAIINSQDEEFEKYTMDNDNLHRHAYYGQEAPIESREGAGVVLEGSKLSD